MACEICADRPHSSACGRCGFKTCQPCCRTYVLSKLQPSWECPGCRLPWDEALNTRFLGKTFCRTVLRRHRREALFLRERRLLQAEEPLAAFTLRRRRLLRERAALQAAARQGDIRAALALRPKWKELRSLRVQPTHRCAAGGCEGVVLEGVCTECEAPHCVRCQQVGGEGHVCDPAVLCSLDLIRETCKPCPGCGVPTARSEGCPVMWCLHCDSFFHWDSLRLMDTRRGVPHNPDHVSLGGRRGREIDDLPCGGLPDSRGLHVGILRGHHEDPVLPSHINLLYDMFESLLLCQRLRHRYAANSRASNRAPRLRLLTGDLTEEGFKRIIENRFRKNAFFHDVSECLECLMLCATDVLQRFCKVGGVHVLLQELGVLREQCDAALAAISYVHVRLAPRLADSWRWTVPR